MDLFASLQPWHWFVFGLLLLGLEALGAGGFLLGTAAAAILLAVFSVVLTISWSWQLILFGCLALVCTVAYWRYFRRFNEVTDHPELNNRAAQMLGRVAVLNDDLVAGQGRVQIADTFWRVKAEEELSAGTRIEVTGCEGMILLVRAK